MKITKKLGDIASIQAGHPMRGKIPRVADSGVYMVQPKNIDEFGRIDWSQVTETELAGRKEPRWLEPGDVIFNMSGKTHFASYVDRVEVPRLAVCHHHFFHLRVAVGGVDPAYLAWFINTAPSQDYLWQQKRARADQTLGSTSRKKRGDALLTVVNKSMLSAFPVWIPDPEHQESILQEWQAYVGQQRELKAQLQASEYSYSRKVRQHVSTWIDGDSMA